MVVNNKYLYTPQVNKTPNNAPVQQVKPGLPENTEFSKVLNDKIQKGTGVKFSKHAEMRLKSRNINLTETDKVKLNDAVLKANAKGVRDSLVLMNNLAFVVNVGSRTVITAVDNSELQENVFTNIDGAVII